MPMQSASERAGAVRRVCEQHGQRDRRLFGRRRFGLSGLGRASGAGRSAPSRSRPIRRRFPNRTSAMPKSSRASMRLPPRIHRDPRIRQSGLRRRTIRTAASTARTNCSRGSTKSPRERGIAHIIYGVNVDDLGDYRPGQGAAKLHEVKAPLVEAGLTKAEIRELSQRAGLATWDRPASACLSSRIPYGTPVTIENVKTVERGEEAIRALGFRQFRVRFHGELVRIEIAPEELERAMTPEMARELHRDLQAARLPLRDAGSGRLPPGLAERGACQYGSISRHAARDIVLYSCSDSAGSRTHSV